eukprot:3932162-Rhodomonas_salina.1
MIILVTCQWCHGASFQLSCTVIRVRATEPDGWPIHRNGYQMHPRPGPARPGPGLRDSDYRLGDDSTA